ncbi:uncharacterized protein CEXT_298701 [Caerostris extrusa]|uniref:Uncharacterized protein n=1 Tax=Caerostris extrusa TaxID=172846 RepID=A0AAV4XXC3_CAEEX|nr:uncharacterized protein CEXT_298701 [Caerostris extrusa]
MSTKVSIRYRFCVHKVNEADDTGTCYRLLLQKRSFLNESEKKETPGSMLRGVGTACDIDPFTALCLLFNWKKNKILRKNKRLCESIVMLQDDGSVGIQKLPASRIFVDRHHTWDYDLTRNEKHQSYPSATQSLELISFPSEDKLVKKSGMEKPISIKHC